MPAVCCRCSAWHWPAAPAALPPRAPFPFCFCTANVRPFLFAPYPPCPPYAAGHPPFPNRNPPCPVTHLERCRPGPLLAANPAPVSVLCEKRGPRGRPLFPRSSSLALALPCSQKLPDPLPASTPVLHQAEQAAIRRAGRQECAVNRSQGLAGSPAGAAEGVRSGAPCR